MSHTPLLLGLLTAVWVSLSACALLGNTQEKELYIHQSQIEILRKLLAAECPTRAVQVTPVTDTDDLDIQKAHYQQLLKELVECRHEGDSTTPPPLPLPEECVTAVNYTEWWRRDHNGSEIRPGGLNSADGRACDLHYTSRDWFRFSGNAGNRLLDSCPLHRSCGTSHAYWTDEEMPRLVGVQTKVIIYGTGDRGRCRFVVRKALVMRCSWDNDHDFIYRQITGYAQPCSHGFCGTE